MDGKHRIIAKIIVIVVALSMVGTAALWAIDLG